jgi:hypothetical protein
VGGDQVPVDLILEQGIEMFVANPLAGTIEDGIADAACRAALKSRILGRGAIFWHSNPGRQTQFALKPRTNHND